MHHDIHLGVTGLRRTGKTVFLTSLIYQLEQLGSQGLDAFENRGVKLWPAEIVESKQDLPTFPYQENLSRLRSTTPTWPERNVKEYVCVLELAYKAGQYPHWYQKAALSALGMARDRGTIRLHLHDYPGEFLLDTPLINLSYDDWSREALGRMRRHCPETAVAYEAGGAHLLATAFDDPASIEQVLAGLRTAYGRYLAIARSGGMEMLQPGIALAAVAEFDEVAEWTTELLPIVPLPDNVPADHPLRAALALSYQKYRDEHVRPFVRRLQRSDRQVVLVDVLRVLRNGVDCFNDTQRCLATIIEAYRVKRVVFAATKADHALKSHRENLRRLLEKLVHKAQGHCAKRVGPMFHEWFSSLRCTKDVYGTHEGRDTEALLGRLVGEDRRKTPIARYPGFVPSDWPSGGEGDEWPFGVKRFTFDECQPQSLPPRNGVPWPQMNLDELLWTVLGDCFLVRKSGILH